MLLVQNSYSFIGIRIYWKSENQFFTEYVNTVKTFKSNKSLHLIKYKF